MNVSLVIPCFASEGTLKNVVLDATSVFAQRPGVEYEIVLVNDGSPDGTLSVIRELARDSRIKGIDLSRNFGQAGATIAGLTYASGEIIVYADDDGQSPIDRLWDLYDELGHEFDAVFAKFTKDRRSLVRDAGAKLNDLMAKVMIGKPSKIQFSNFWACRRFVAEEVLKSPNPLPYIGGLVLNATQNLSSLPMERHARIRGESGYTARKLLSLWLNGFIGFSVLPLRLGTLVGLVIGLAGLIFALVLVVRWIVELEAPPFYTLGLAGILLLGGINISLVGLVGEYVGRAYMNLNKVPQFVVREVMNVNDL